MLPIQLIDGTLINGNTIVMIKESRIHLNNGSQIDLKHLNVHSVIDDELLPITHSSALQYGRLITEDLLIPDCKSIRYILATRYIRESVTHTTDDTTSKGSVYFQSLPFEKIINCKSGMSKSALTKTFEVRFHTDQLAAVRHTNEVYSDFDTILRHYPKYHVFIDNVCVYSPTITITDYEKDTVTIRRDSHE